MIDAGSPKTIFTKEELSRLLKPSLIFARLPTKKEGYVDYNGRPLKLAGYITVEAEIERSEDRDHS